MLRHAPMQLIYHRITYFAILTKDSHGQTNRALRAINKGFPKDLQIFSVYEKNIASMFSPEL